MRLPFFWSTASVLLQSWVVRAKTLPCKAQNIYPLALQEKVPNLCSRRMSKDQDVSRKWKIIILSVTQVALVVKKKKKNPLASAEDMRDSSSIPGLGRSPGGGHGNPLQYSCLENPMDRAWRAAVHGVAKWWTRLKQLSTHRCTGTKLSTLTVQNCKWSNSVKSWISWDMKDSSSS